jgi:hypothetical protein
MRFSTYDTFIHGLNFRPASYDVVNKRQVKKLVDVEEFSHFHRIILYKI